MAIITIIYASAMAVFLIAGLAAGRRLRGRNITQKKLFVGKIPTWRYLLYAAVVLVLLVFRQFLYKAVFSNLPAGPLLLLIPFIYISFSCLTALGGGINFSLFYRSDRGLAIRSSVLLLLLSLLIFGMFLGNYVLPLREISHHVDRNGLTYQTTGFICGPASLATLLRLWGMELTERELAQRMYTGLGGTNLAANRHVLKKWGFTAREVPCQLEQAAVYNLPFIASIDFYGIKHQVIVGGLTTRSVVLLDPNVGIVIQTRKEFEDWWLAAMTVVPEGLENVFTEPTVLPELYGTGHLEPPQPSLAPLWAGLTEPRISQCVRTSAELLNTARLLDVGGYTGADTLYRHLSARGASDADDMAGNGAAGRVRTVAVSLPGRERPVTVRFAYPVPILTVFIPRILTEAIPAEQFHGQPAAFPDPPPDLLDETAAEAIVRRWPAIRRDELGPLRVTEDGTIEMPHVFCGIPVFRDRLDRPESVRLRRRGETVEVAAIRWSRVAYYQSGTKKVGFPHEAAERVVKTMARHYDAMPSTITVESMVYLKQGMLLWPCFRAYAGDTALRKPPLVFVSILNGKVFTGPE